MTPALCTSLANRLFPYRWWFFAWSLLFVALFVAAMAFVSSPRVVGVGGSLVGPLVFGPWALLCLCVWFHPQRGNLQPSSKVVGRLPPFVQSAIRWYAAVCLLLFLVVSVVVWPLLSLTWL